MNLEYTHQIHPRSRSLKMSIQPDGMLLVTTPPRTPSHTIEGFIAQNSLWIQKQRRRIQNRIHAHSPEGILLFGQRYPLHIDSEHHMPGISVSNGKLVLNPSHLDQSWQTSATTKQLTSFLKHTAQRYIHPRTNQLAQKMTISFGKITYREQKSRWGSCSSKGNLNFNWRLVHAPPKVIDYVIIHELAHRLHLDHSASFWALVAKFDGEYKQNKNWLRQFALPPKVGHT